MDNTKEIKDSMKEKRQVLVLGIGNILLRDEGVGPYVINILKDESLPEYVELLDGGTAGADLLDDICDRKKVIVIDAIDAEVEPGSIMCFDGYSIQSQAEYMSLHQCGILETLAIAIYLGSAPEEVLVI
ncbi:MAG: hydrogenase maturation protease, partial [Thiotrichaceae bacterium]